MAKIIEPKTLSGFMELLPNEQILFDRLKNIIEKNYIKFGFLPLDTPVIESSEVLLAKAGGETEKQIYTFEKGDSSLTLRFDLTVPLAKFTAKNSNDLAFPYRRYQIGKVYRGERPQKGRFREFYQCDIDIIGRDNLSIINEAEIPTVIYNIFKELNFGDFTINISNRKLLLGLLESLDLVDISSEVLRMVDKIDKIDKQVFVDTLTDTFGIDKVKVAKILYLISIKGTNDEILTKLGEMQIDNDTYKAGIDELTDVVKYIRLFNIPEKNFVINLAISRGLDYYTGTVYETFLDDYPSIGSVCSGGRYDNLTGFYSNGKFPGVGISIGLTRLFYQLNEMNLLKFDNLVTAQAIVLPFGEDLTYAIEIVNILRNNNINSILYGENAKVKNKLAYADRLNIPFAIIVGEDEQKTNTVSIKNMITGTQQTISKDAIIDYLLKQNK